MVELPIRDDAPTALDDEAEVDEDASVMLDVLSNDTDPQALALSVASFTQPSNGTVTQVAGGKLKFTPAQNWSGETSFTFRATNGTTQSNEATVTIRVSEINDPPVVTSPGPQTKAEDGEVSLPVTSADVDDEAFIFTATGLPPGLIWGWVGPVAAGSYEVTVSVRDLRDGVGTTTFRWSVTDTNHRPRLPLRDPHFAIAGQFNNIPVLGAFGTDIDGESFTLTYAATGLPPGTFSNGVISGHIPADATGRTR